MTTGRGVPDGPPWADGAWLNPPPWQRNGGGVVRFAAMKGSDFWRGTAYGFVHDNGHALLNPFPDDCAVEVSFLLDFTEQFDQAGVLVRADECNWVKAGVEISDGTPQIGAVVTRGNSDWSVAPAPPAWKGKEVTVRVSRTGGALVIRARAAGGQWQLVRVCPGPSDGPLLAGLYFCAPTREGLVVTFTSVGSTKPDVSLHPT